MRVERASPFQIKQPLHVEILPTTQAASQAIDEIVVGMLDYASSADSEQVKRRLHKRRLIELGGTADLLTLLDFLHNRGLSTSMNLSYIEGKSSAGR